MIKKNLIKTVSGLLVAAMVACSVAVPHVLEQPVETTSVEANYQAKKDADSQQTLANAISLFTSGSNGTGSVKSSSSATQNSKDETVFVFTDVNGKQTQAIVNEKLRNVEKSSNISDETSLTDIENLSGDEAFNKGAGDKLSWAANGNSITYQGKTTKAAPVTIKVTYKLNGVTMSPSEIAGKSGRVTIRYDYTNNEKKTITVNGKTKNVTVPFTMITGLLLDSNTFSNIQVNNGKLIESDKGAIAMGITLPGFSKSLESQVGSDLVDLDIPEYFEVSADAENFEIGMSLSMATSNLLTDMNLDEINTADIDKDLKDLGDAADQLTEGSAALADGTGELASKVPELTDGIQQLATGAISLKDGAVQVNDGTKAAADGAAQLSAGALAAKNGVAELNGRFREVTDGLASAAPGASQLAAGLGTVDQLTGKTTEETPTTIASALYQFKTGTTALKNGTDQLSAGISKLASSIDTLHEGAQAVADGTASIQTGMDTQLDTAKETNVTEIKKVIEKEGAAATQYNATLAAFGLPALTAASDLQTVSAENAQTLLTNYMNAYAQATAAKDTIIAGIKGKAVQDNLAAIQAGAVTREQVEAAAAPKAEETAAQLPMLYLQEVGDLTTVMSYGASNTTIDTIKSNVDTSATSGDIAKLKAGAQQVADGIGTSADITTPVAGEAKSIAAGIGQLGVGINQVGNGAGALSSGANALSDSFKKVIEGSAQLTAGVAKLGAGIGTTDQLTGKDLPQNQTVASALYQLQLGTIQLSDGTNELSAGAAKLYDGTAQLSAGAAALEEGTGKLNDGAGALGDGVNQLNEGAIQLHDGMVQFNEEGISKIEQLLGTDAKDALDTVKAITDLGKDYQSFAGKDAATNGSVKFIYKTEGVNK